MAASTSRPTLDDETQEEAPRRRAIPAIEKAVIVMEVLAAAEEALTFSQLAARVTMAKSSLHDVCSSLIRTGLAEKTPEGRYTLGLKLVELSRNRLASTQIVSAFHGVSRAMPPPSHTVVLAVLSGADVVYVAFIDGGQPLAVRYKIGMRLPAAFTASGKAILATLPLQTVRELVGRFVVNPNAGGTRKSVRTLLTELEETRTRGYSIDDEETAAGMACIGAPVFAAGDEAAVGAVAVSFAKSTADAFDEAKLRYVQMLAARVTEQLGGRRFPGLDLSRPSGARLNGSAEG